MAFSARVLADSLSPHGIRLATLEVTIPRIVLAEFNTHRVFSRCSASSRAIPVAKQIERVVTDPFIPIHWGKNQRGMQADQELSDTEKERATEEWLTARNCAVAQAQSMILTGVHKQITNRLLEPWMWQTIIVSATHWKNFFGLRLHKDAQPEFRRAACLMRDAMVASIPRVVQYGEWHLPLVGWGDRVRSDIALDDMPKVSAGRCARVSYLTHDGRRDPKADVDLCEKLLVSGHMSPLEHPATPQLVPHDEGNLYGWTQFRQTVPNQHCFEGETVEGVDR